MKQTIEIDVPDGYELNVFYHQFCVEELGVIEYRFKKKEPEFIEVRDYLCKSVSGNYLIVTKNKLGFLDDEKLPPDAIKWLGDWRKVQI